MQVKNEININLREMFPLIYITLIGFVSLFFNISYLFIFGLFPLVLINREWLMPILMLPSLVDGALSNEEMLITLGILNVILLIPILYFYNINSKHSLSGKYRIYLALFIGLLLLGLLVYHFIFGVTVAEIIENLIRLSKVIFFFMLLKFLINQSLDYFKNSIKRITQTMVIMIFIVEIYSLFMGDTNIGKYNYLMFGDAKHGSFSATVSAYSLYVVASLIKSKKQIVKLLLVVYLGFTFYFILQLGSKNGLLSYGLMVIAGFWFLMPTRQNYKRALVLIGVFISATIAVIAFYDKIISSPTIYRLATQYESGGVERTSSGRSDIWESAMLAFPDAPIFGWGGSNKAPKFVSTNYGKGMLDNTMHNIYMDFLVQYGLIGLILILSFTLFVFKHGRIIYQYCKEKNDFTLFEPVIIVAMLLFSGMFVPWSWEVTIWFNAIFVLAIGYRVYKTAYFKKRLF